MKKLFMNKDIILENIVANNNRKTITINENGLLIVNVKANNFDKNCINNYYRNCNIELNYRSYVGNLIKGFEKSRNSSYERFEILILGYCTSFHIIDKVINDYYEYLNNHILFKIYIEEVKYLTKFKELSQ